MPTGDLDALKHLYDEGRANVEHQIAKGAELDTKASQIFRFNTLVIGILVSAISILLRFDDAPFQVGDWVLYTMAAGVVLLGVSTLLAILAYMVTEFAMGLRAEDLGEAHAAGFEEAALLEEMVAAYTRAVAANRTNIDATANHLKRALWTLFAGLVVLGTSAVGLIYYAASV